MTSRAVVLRERAVVDVEHALDWYRANAGTAIALRFVGAFERTLGRIARHPNAGAPLFGEELALPGSRSVRIAGFPYLAVHVKAHTHLDVWRVLHGVRDLPALFQDDR